MSKAEILAEIPKLTKAEREEIALKLAELDDDGWLDADDPLTDAEKALIEMRVADLEKHPEKSIPWVEAEPRLKALFGEFVYRVQDELITVVAVLHSARHDRHSKKRV